MPIVRLAVEDALLVARVLSLGEVERDRLRVLNELEDGQPADLEGEVTEADLHRILQLLDSLDQPGDIP